MVDLEETQKEVLPREAEETIQSQPKKSPTETRNERLNQIDQELRSLHYKAISPEEIQQIQERREREYQSTVKDFEKELGTMLSDESKNMIRQNMVDNVIEQAQKDNEKFNELQKEKIRLETMSAKVKGIMADNPEISEEDAARYATEEVEKGIIHKPITIEGDPEEVKARQAESERIRDRGETIEQPLESERGKELTDAIQDVASLFNKMGVQWKLDGALNISLREITKGEEAYFRMHRDIDVHVIGDIDGGQLSRMLKETKFEGAPHGYGAFVNDELLNKPELVQKRGYLATEFNKGEVPNQGLRFFRLDENGNPHFKIGEIVIDVHCSHDKLKSITGQELPEAWQTEGDKVNVNGEMVSLDHTGSVLYHKLTTGRERDFIDIDIMIENGQIKPEDVDEVRGVVQKDLESKQIHSDQKEALQKALEKLNGINKKIKLPK